MNMHSRNQYLKKVRIEYLKTKSKMGKGRLLDEARKRTGMNRKYIIRKLRPLSNLDKIKPRHRRRKEFYDGYVSTALVRYWEIFDYPCPQRLKPILRNEVQRLIQLGELGCSDEVAGKLRAISARTIDEKLRHQREVEGLRRKYHRKKHPLLYQKYLLSSQESRTGRNWGIYR